MTMFTDGLEVRRTLKLNVDEALTPLQFSHRSGSRTSPSRNSREFAKNRCSRLFFCTGIREQLSPIIYSEHGVLFESPRHPKIVEAMRLTLRTLLAHLDRTLEADDDNAIAAKLRESEFAANLVKRIGVCIANDRLVAPSPVSMGTADDANRISEYLDSVLSSEQIAEIERICLESDSHLAEVAACHQILTIVLGKPAEVPVTLRSRVYELGQQRAGTSVVNPQVNGNVGGTVNPTSPLVRGAAPQADSLTRAIAESDAPVALSAGRQRQATPVGPDDSGVSDAPTRLREASLTKPQASRREPAIAGSRQLNAAEASEVFGRSSRVVPWLVSLALAASFLFVAVQAFAPLLRNRSNEDEKPIAFDTGTPTLPPVSSQEDEQAKSPGDDATSPSLEIEATEVPPMVDVEAANSDSNPAETSPDLATAAPVSDLGPVAPEVAELPMPVPSIPVTGSDSTPDETAVSNEVDPTSGELLPPMTEDPDEDAPPPPTPVEVTPDADEVMPVVEPTNGAPVIPAGQVLAAAASVVSDQSLVLVRKPELAVYVLVKKGESLPLGSEVVCPPLYRDRLTVAESVDLTMVGPTRLGLLADKAGGVAINLVRGRVLLAPLQTVTPDDATAGVASAPGVATVIQPIRIIYAGKTHTLTFSAPDDRAAIEIKTTRNPGADPEDPKSTALFLSVLSVQGSLLCQFDGTDDVSIVTGEELRWSPTIAISKSTPTQVPEWIEPAPLVPGSLDQSAREGLLTLVRENESIELSLRESIEFRRSEVGALAAQTLLIIDRPDVYFGTDGIFSDVKQKTFWPAHHEALVATIDQGPESAKVIREAIDGMDATDGNAIYRLLWLYSNAQLEAGADELLVKSLDSANMTVRVLAAENLRRITGTTLFYKPENETAPRRASDIKKWETRLRKGDIRWPSTEVPAVN